MGILALVLSIIALIAVFIPGIGLCALIPETAGIILAVIAICKKAPLGAPCRLSKAALFVSIATMIIIAIAGCILTFGCCNSQPDGEVVVFGEEVFQPVPQTPPTPQGQQQIQKTPLPKTQK